jgi:hypothetical protein
VLAIIGFPALSLIRDFLKQGPATTATGHGTSKMLAGSRERCTSYVRLADSIKIKLRQDLGAIRRYGINRCRQNPPILRATGESAPTMGKSVILGIKRDAREDHADMREKAARYSDLGTFRAAGALRKSCRSG